MENNNETGRSMLEMLGVLVIMIVLIIACMAGYDYLVQFRNRQETVKMVDSLVVHVKSADLARKVSKNTLIEAEDILNGPKTEDGVFVLPGAENSYAVVRSLVNGGFALALQVDPGTCDAVLESMSAQGMTVFGFSGERSETTGSFKSAAENAVTAVFGGDDCTDDSCNGVDLSFRDEIKEGKTKALLDNIEQECVSSGRLMTGIGCSVGSNPDHHGTGFACSDCASGETKGVDGPCCSTSEICDGYCYCPGRSGISEGKTWIAGVCHCQECDENAANNDAAHCKKDFGLYAKHVCYGTGQNARCRECKKDADCRMNSPYIPQNYNDKANYAVFEGHQMSCVNRDGEGFGVCRECTLNYDDSKSYSGTDTAFSDGHGNAYCPQNRPTCDVKSGSCVPCADGKEWDSTKKECVCPSGYIEYNNECVACVDNQSYGAEDKGCGGDVGPICYPTTEHNAANDTIYHNGVTKDLAEGMTRETACVQCIYDQDCTQENQYCDSYAGRSACGDQTVCSLRNYAYTYTCKTLEIFCQDTAAGSAQDSKCDKEPGNTLCVPDNDNTKNLGNGAAGSQCMYCFDSNPDSGAKDDGCDKDPTKLLCEPTVGLYGSSCHVCQVRAGEQDFGCGSGAWEDKTLCEPNAGSVYGEVCRHCKNDQYGTGSNGENLEANTDLGCTDDASLCPTAENEYSDKQCKVCKNDKTEADQDSGCGKGKWSQKPFCNAPADEYGTKCYSCYQKTDHTGTGPAENDFGCGEGDDAEKPLCVSNSSDTVYGNTCRKCRNTVDDETQDSQTTFTNQYVDYGCSIEKPYCISGNSEIALNEYGDTCAVAQPACSGGYYYALDDSNYVHIDQDSAYCPQGGCSSSTCTDQKIWYNDTWVRHACVCPEPAPCTDGYYFANNSTYLPMDDYNYCQKMDCSASTCTPQEITDGQGTVKKLACVCDAKCLDGFYLSSGDGQYEELTVGSDACTQLGGCTKDNEKFSAKALDETRLNACVATDSCPENQCYHPETSQCIPYKEDGTLLWDDLNVKDENGRKVCPCFDVVATPYFDDTKNHKQELKQGTPTPTKGGSARSKRQITYSVKPKFYCERYFYVDLDPDDFVIASNPGGIGTKFINGFDYGYQSPDWYDDAGHPIWAGYLEAMGYKVYPNHSNTVLAAKKQSTASVTISDYWLTDMGMKGYFYFPTVAYKKANYLSDKTPCYTPPKAGLNSDGKSRLKITAGSVTNKEYSVNGAWISNTFYKDWVHCKNSNCFARLKDTYCKGGQLKCDVSFRSHNPNCQ